MTLEQHQHYLAVLTANHSEINQAIKYHTLNYVGNADKIKTYIDEIDHLSVDILNEKMILRKLLK